MIRVEDAFHLCFGFKHFFKLMCMHDTVNPHLINPLLKKRPLDQAKRKRAHGEFFSQGLLKQKDRQKISFISYNCF